MDFSNFFINIILILISIVTWFNYFCLLLVLLQSSTKKSTDLYKYKLKNKSLSLYLAIIYIFILIFFMYGLRIYNLHHTLDLKVVYQNCLVLLDFVTYLPLFLIFNFILLCILSLILALILLLSFHKFFISHIFKLYLYYTHSIKSEKFHTYLWKIRWIGPDDVLTYFCQYILYKATHRFYGANVKNVFLNKYNIFNILNFILHHRYYRNVITCSPIIVIAYDCMFNAWVLTNVYYYLLLYVPLIIIRRITTNLLTQAGYIMVLLCNIYYKKELCIYAISQKYKRMLDIYLLSELRDNPDLGRDSTIFLEATLKYHLDNKERNTYRNDEGIYLQKTLENRVFLEVEIEDEEGNITYTRGEEWILLADKTMNDQDEYVNKTNYIVTYMLLVGSSLSLFYLCYMRNLTVILFTTIPVHKSYIFSIAVILICIISYLWVTKDSINKNKYVNLMKHYLLLSLTSSIIIVTIIVFIRCNVIDYYNDFLLNNAWITIINHYTLYEKQNFLIHYLAYIIQYTPLTTLQMHHLLHLLNDKDYINYVTTLKTIEEDMEMFVLYYSKMIDYHNYVYYDQCTYIVNEMYNNDNNFRNLYNFIRNSIGILTVFYTVDYYHTLYCIFNHLRDPAKVFDIIEMIKHYFK